MNLFGSGALLAYRTDIANATPVEFGTLQDVSVEFAFTKKALFGTYQFPKAVARGTAQINCKAHAADIRGMLLGSIFFADTPAAPALRTAYKEAANVPAVGPYTYVVANGATFVADFGVMYANGTPLVKVAAGPAQGQYSVNPATGTYTFAAADEGAAVLISYTWNAAANVGQKIVVANPILGAAPVFAANLYAPFAGKQLTLTLNQCIADKLSFNTKLEDFVIPEFDFSGMADVNNNVLTLGLDDL